MSTYDYRAGRARVEEILNNRTEVIKQDSIPKDDQFTYDNGYYGWVTAIFVDIRDSTALFQNDNKVIVSKVIRSFTSEIIEILNSDNNLREIGIRGDCVYAIYTTSVFDDVYEIADKAFFVNTFIRELNILLAMKSYPNIRVGIGVSTAKELVVKAGRKSSGVKNLVWIGEAVTQASNLSSIGGKDGYPPLIFSEYSYICFINKLERINPLAKSWFSLKSSPEYGNFYPAYVVKSKYDDWINEGMPD